MRVERDVRIGAIDVKVKELTLGEIRAWLKESATAPGDVIDATLFEDFDAQDLRYMTDLRADQLDTLTPSECRALAAICEEVNADFFAMRKRVVVSGHQLLSATSNYQSQL